MIKLFTRVAVVLGLAIAGLPVAQLAAQTSSPAEIQALEAELQQLHQQLESAQRQAMRDPELVAVQRELGEDIQAAMGDFDPTVDQSIERMGELEAAAMEARANEDAEQMQTLIAEAQGIQQHLMEVQQEVLESPEFASRLESLQTRLENKMIEMDPAVEDLLVRFREVEAQLLEATGA